MGQLNTGHAFASFPRKKEVFQTMIKLAVKGMRHSEVVQWVTCAQLRLCERKKQKTRKSKKSKKEDEEVEQGEKGRGRDRGRKGETEGRNK